MSTNRIADDFHYLTDRLIGLTVKKFMRGFQYSFRKARRYRDSVVADITVSGYRGRMGQWPPGTEVEVTLTFTLDDDALVATVESQLEKDPAGLEPMMARQWGDYEVSADGVHAQTFADLMYDIESDLGEYEDILDDEFWPATKNLRNASTITSRIRALAKRVASTGDR
jgi:hypothetical protein